MSNSHSLSKIILFSLIISIVVLSAFEFTISKMLVREKYPSLKYIEYSALPGLEFKSECCKYQLIDPLLGWGLTDDQIKEKGLIRKNNCIFLKSYNSPDSGDTVRIYLSGGSTTDIAYNPKNWPVILMDSIKKAPINVELYVAAISGYSTSQEFLKFMRDGISIKPNFVISYNGANEILYPSYTTIFEYSFYARALFAEQSSVVLPYTVFLIKEAFGLNQPIDLKSPPDTTKFFQQWEKNMVAMDAVSTANGAEFFGVLQPVMNSNLNPTEKDFAAYAYLYNKYPLFYSKALEVIPKHPFLANYYQLFDKIGKQVFIDHCHIKDEYQYIVADSMLHLIQRSIAEKQL